MLEGLLLAQALLSFTAPGDGPLRFGFPLPARQLSRGLRLESARGSRLQWRTLQSRPDPHAGRIWVELAITGARGRCRILAGGAGPADPSEGTVVRYSRQRQEDDKRRVVTEHWQWHTGEKDSRRRVTFLQSFEHPSGEVFASGETLTELSEAMDDRWLVGIKTKSWRSAGVLPPGGRLGRDYRKQLLEAARNMQELPGLRDRGDYLRSSEVITNLEFDTTLALGRLGLATGSAGLLRRARAAAFHLVDRDLDARTGLAHTHGRGHRQGPPDPGHSWLSGLLLLGCLTADDYLIGNAHRMAGGLARYPVDKQGKKDRARDLGWPLGELETFLVFAQDPQVEEAADHMAARLLRKWDPKNRVFRFGEGEGGRGIYEERAWITGGALLPALRLHLRRSKNPKAKAIIQILERRLAALVRSGKPGLPIRLGTIGGKVIWQSRVTDRVEGFMLLEGLATRELRRCLGRAMVRGALAGVPKTDDPDLATNFSIAARCTWVYR